MQILHSYSSEFCEFEITVSTLYITDLRSVIHSVKYELWINN